MIEKSICEHMRDSIEEQPPPSSYAQALQIMVSAVRYQPLDDRLKEYIAEKEMEQMNYILITENMVSLNLRLRQFCLPAFYSH